MATNAIVTKITTQRFNFETETRIADIKRNAKAAQKTRNQKRIAELRPPNATPNQTTIMCGTSGLSLAEAEAWAAELDKEHKVFNGDKMSEEYNHWHTLDDNLDTLALLRGIHNIQERGGNAADEQHFLNTVTDYFGHERL